jgi:hypothetical protein
MDVYHIHRDNMVLGGVTYEVLFFEVPLRPMAVAKIGDMRKFGARDVDPNA